MGEGEGWGWGIEWRYLGVGEGGFERVEKVDKWLGVVPPSREGRLAAFFFVKEGGFGRRGGGEYLKVVK